MSHENLYDVWCEFGRRSDTDQEILRKAGKDNCHCLNCFGMIVGCDSKTCWSADIRYCLRPEYKIPEESKIIELVPFKDTDGMMRVEAGYTSTCHGAIAVSTISSQSQFRGYKWKDGYVTRVLDARFARKVEDEYEWPVVLWEVK